MATITTRAGKGSALTFEELDANFTNLNNELANVSLGVLPANSVSATELDNSDDYTVNTVTTTGNVIVGDSLIPSSGNLEVNTDYLVVSDASGTEKFKIRTDQSPGPDQVLKYNETTGFVQWATDLGQTSTQVQSALTSQVLNEHADVDTTGVTDGQALVYVSANAQWEAGTVSGGGGDVVDDTTPQLGGDLDVNGNDIVSVSAGNVSIAPDSANSEGYSTATLDSSSGHFFLKSGLVLDHPGTAGLAAQYSNYITVNTTDGDLNMSANGTGKVRPRSHLQIRGSDGCDLQLRSEYSTDAKMAFLGGTAEEGALSVDRNNQEVKYYTDSWDQVFQSDSGQTRILNYGGNVEIRSRDSNNSSKGNVIVRADNKIELRAGDDEDSKGDLVLTSFDDFQFRKSGYASTDTDLTPTTDGTTSVVLGRALTDGEQNAYNDYSLYFFDGDPDVDSLTDMSRYRLVDSDTAITGSGATTTITLFDAITNLSNTTHSAAQYLMFKSNSPAVVVDGTRGRLNDKTVVIQNRIGAEGPVGMGLKFHAVEYHDGYEYLGTGTGESDEQEESPVTYELKTFANQNQLKLEHSTTTAGSQTTTDIFSIRNSTTTTSTVASKTTPDQMRMFVDFDTNGNAITSNTNLVKIDADVVEQYDAKGQIITNMSQGSTPDLTSEGADFGTVYGQGIDIQSNGSYSALNLWSHKSNSAYPNMWAHRSRESGGNKDFLDNGDRIFSFLGSGWDGSADTAANFYGAYAPVGELILVANEDHSASARGGKWQFRTTSTGSTSGSTKMEVGDHISALTAIELSEVSTPTTTTDKGWIYAKDVSGTAEVFVKDAAGNETQISPHNAQGEWEYFSRNVKTGKTVRINMEEMIRDIEQLTGKTYIKDE